MATTEPWHVAASETGGPDVGGGDAVYHDNPECPIGAGIAPERRVPGKRRAGAATDLPQCQTCAGLR